MLFTPHPLSQTVTPSRTPSPLERGVLYGRPLRLEISFSALISERNLYFIKVSAEKPIIRVTISTEAAR